MSELQDAHQARLCYVDPAKRRTASDSELKAMQKKALLEFYHRKQCSSGQLNNASQPPPPHEKKRPPATAPKPAHVTVHTTSVAATSQTHVYQVSVCASPTHGPATELMTAAH